MIVNHLKSATKFLVGCTLETPLGGQLLRKLLLPNSIMPIIVYHSIAEKFDPFFPSVTTSNFKHQLDFLRHRYDIVPLGPFIESCTVSASRPSRNHRPPVAITFDDGLHDFITCAYPLLQHYRVPLTLFLPTVHIDNQQPLWPDLLAYAVKTTRVGTLTYNGLHLAVNSRADRLHTSKYLSAQLKRIPADECERTVDEIIHQLEVEPANFIKQKRMLNWDEVRTLDPHRVEIGSHGANHRVLTQVTHDGLISELLTSKLTLERHLNRPVRGIAYPNGYANETVAWEAARAGYVYGLQTGGRLNRLRHGQLITNRYLLFRITAYECTIPTFSAELSEAFVAARSLLTGLRRITNRSLTVSV